MLRGRPSTVNRGNYVTLFCLGFPMGGENLALIQLEQGRLTKATDFHYFVKFMTCLRFLHYRCSPDVFSSMTFHWSFPKSITRTNNPTSSLRWQWMLIRYSPFSHNRFANCAR